MFTRRRWGLAACLWLGAVSGLSAATIYVDGTNGADVPGCGGAPGASACETIQGGLDRAAASGDIVRVLPGTYPECPDTGTKRVTLLADACAGTSCDPARTIIDASGVALCDPTNGNFVPAVHLADGSTLKGFTVQGGGDSGVASFGSVAITRNVITGNTVSSRTDGGGIYAVVPSAATGTISIEYNDVTNNTAFARGGGIFAGCAQDPSDPQGVLDCRGEVNIKKNRVLDNRTTSAPGLGAGLFLRTKPSASDQGRIVITQNVIEGNVNDTPLTPEYLAGYGGGVWAGAYGYGTSSVEITDNMVHANLSAGFGGGIGAGTFTSDFGYATILISGNTIQDNLSIDPSGGVGYGGGIWSSTFGYGTETIRITNNAVTTNTSLFDGGGISAWLLASYTGIHTVQVEGNDVSSNEADRGGGMDLFLQARNIPPDAELELSATNNLVTGNAAVGDTGWGGGIFTTLDSVRTEATGMSFDVRGNTISGNTAGVAGGGALLFLNADGSPVAGVPPLPAAPARGEVRFRDNLVSGNHALDLVSSSATGGGVFAYLQAIGDAIPSVDMDFNTIVGNTTDFGSGGVELESFTDEDTAPSPVEGEARVSITNSILLDNGGIGAGGPVPGDAGTVTFGGTGNFNVAVRYTDAFGNQDVDYESWITLPPGGGNLFVDPLLDAQGVPGACSPTLDAADPTAEFSLEPEPNGGRANMGHLGGTAGHLLRCSDDPDSLCTSDDDCGAGATCSVLLGCSDDPDSLCTGDADCGAGATCSVRVFPDQQLAVTTLPDVSGDDFVDGIDILRIASAFAATSGQPHFYAPADLDGDGDVDGDDLAYVASRFGADCR